MQNFNNTQNLWSILEVASLGAQSSGGFIGEDVASSNWLELLSSGLRSPVSKIRFLFYLVWPSEIMFSSLELVPRYVTEVSLRDKRRLH